MKRLFLIACALFLCAETFAAKSYKLVSPNGKLEVAITAEPKLSYSILCDGEMVLAPSQIGLKIHSGVAIGESVKVKRVKRTTVNTTIPTKFYFRDEIKDHYNALRIDFAANYGVEFRAYDEGVVYRFVTNFKNEFILENEIAEFAFAKDYNGYFPYTNKTGTRKDNYFTSFESWYRICELSRFDKERVAFVPVIVEHDNYDVCILESDVEHYPGMFVSNKKGATALRGEFAPMPDRVVVGGHNKLQGIVESRKPYIAECKAKTNTPWRIVLVTEDKNTLLDNDMVYRLASPSRVEDTSWIKPGKVAWEWWNYWGLTGVPFKAGINTETYNYYVDFAAKHGVEYVILDEGWAVKYANDLTQVVPEIDLKAIIENANKKGVGIILWAGYNAVKGKEEVVCRHFAEMGVKGFKVDFLDRDDVDVVDFQYKLAELAAKYKLIIDFHGCPKPTGMNRTYPNVLNFEAVLGLENAKFRNGYKKFNSVEYDLHIPYLRMVAGPMDYTQGAMRNANKKCFYPCNTAPMSLGTRCRQLAMYAIYFSPFAMLCDSPILYEREAECTKFIAEFPTVWNETVTLDGHIGDYVAMARRSGDTWYVGVMGDWTPRKVELDLSKILGEGNYVAEVFRDGLNADRLGEDYIHETVKVPASRKMVADLAPAGGYVLKITKK
ncbi:MAG: glycoside hydrolase family 97 protein [Rikenellaceae bacterium]|nr:glycoside hydrolase family 97 protein [Rikenellaceae bacterium]